MDWWLELSLPVRLMILFLVGVTLAGQLNRAIYRWTWHPLNRDPWTPPLEGAPPRHWYDRIPVFGWLTISRESALHATAYWVQPLLIELGMGFFLAWFYHFSITGGALPEVIGVSPDTLVLHGFFLRFSVLVALMVIATFIDFDTRIIPDQVTVPGVLLGLLLCAWLPQSALPIPEPPLFYQTGFERHVDSSFQVVAAAMLASAPAPGYEPYNGTWGLGLGLLLVSLWWLAIAPKIVWLRGSFNKAIRIWVGSFRRYALNWFYLALLLLLWVMVGAVWLWCGTASWQAVLTGLLGMGFGGMLIWLVRIAAGVAMGKEAMGFGDVTLMAMIGVYVGWQPVTVIFFLAPCIACVFAVIRWLMTGDAYLAFGPYLCMATLAVILGWGHVWQQYGPILQLGGWLPALFLSLPLVLGVMLAIWGWIKWNLIYRE